MLLGLLVLLLGALRVTWRRTTPLPPGDPRLTPRLQHLVKHTEAVLLTLLFRRMLPGSG